MKEYAVKEISLPKPRGNRPITIAHRAEFALAVVLGLFFKFIGIDASSALAGGLMRLVGPLIAPISDRARANLKIAFPNWTSEEIDATIRDVWENLGRTSAEFSSLEKFNPNLRGSRVEVVGRDKINFVANSKRPAIFVSGHFANWEVMSIVLQSLGLNYGVIYRAANNPLIDSLIIKVRARVMSRRQIPKGKRGGRDMIEAMKAGVSLAMLVDQKLTSGGISSPFFGKPAMTAPAPARLALKYQAPIIPIEIERLNGARFRVVVRDPIAFSPSGNINADTQKLTDLINLEIEAMIRARPGQWLWLHRRWPKENYR